MTLCDLERREKILPQPNHHRKAPQRWVVVQWWCSLGEKISHLFEMTILTTVIPSVCEESFPIVLMLIGVELHHYPAARLIDLPESIC